MCTEQLESAGNGHESVRCVLIHTVSLEGGSGIHELCQGVPEPGVRARVLQVRCLQYFVRRNPIDRINECGHEDGPGRIDACLL